jgi:hypothetical protein
MRRRKLIAGLGGEVAWQMVERWMRDPLVDGRLQATAALSLLEKSYLVEWRHDNAQFKVLERDLFEEFCKELDPVFGRVMTWILFSAGAEFLAKAACLLNGVEIRKDKRVPQYPSEDIADWIGSVKIGSVGTITTTSFGTIGDLTWRGKRGNLISPLESLSARKSATAQEADLVFAVYELLGKTIRNRDAHAYVPNVRNSHHHLVSGLFVEALNILACWLPGGANVLNEWTKPDIALAFIKNLPPY